MTINIKITNEDSREKAIVKVHTINKGVKSLLPIVNPPVELKGGESVTKYVYDTQSILVEELQND